MELVVVVVVVEEGTLRWLWWLSFPLVGTWHPIIHIIHYPFSIFHLPYTRYTTRWIWPLVRTFNLNPSRIRYSIILLFFSNLSLYTPQHSLPPPSCNPETKKNKYEKIRAACLTTFLTSGFKSSYHGFIILKLPRTNGIESSGISGHSVL